jgi:hypothetical protein
MSNEKLYSYNNAIFIYESTSQGNQSLSLFTVSCLKINSALLRNSLNHNCYHDKLHWTLFSQSDY